jgi:zinc transport system permease protein
LLVALIVALGLKVAGTLLMGSLVIIPAAAAKNISSNMSQYGFLAMVFGVISSGAGLFLAKFSGIEPGPTIVLSAGVIFLVTLFIKK